MGMELHKDPYRNSVKIYDLVIGSFNTALKRKRQRFAPPIRGMKMLDVGCGTGADLELYSRVGCDVYGVEVSPAMLRAARRRLGDRADLCLCSAAQLPFKDKFFDLVLSTYTLHEIPYEDRSSVILEMMRVVKSNGRILLTDFLPGPFRFPDGWINEMLNFIAERLAGRQHYKNGRDFIRRGGLRGLVEHSRLKVERQTVVGGGNIAFFLLSTQCSDR